MPGVLSTVVGLLADRVRRFPERPFAEILHPDGSIDTGYTGTVHFSSSDGQAGLPADYTFTTADAGVHMFSAMLKTAGTQSITATDTTTASDTGSETGIAVNPAAGVSNAAV